MKNPEYENLIKRCQDNIATIKAESRPLKFQIRFLKKEIAELEDYVEKCNRCANNLVKLEAYDAAKLVQKGAKKFKKKLHSFEEILATLIIQQRKLGAECIYQRNLIFMLKESD